VGGNRATTSQHEHFQCAVVFDETKLTEGCAFEQRTPLSSCKRRMMRTMCSATSNGEPRMNNIFYIIGVIVVIGLVFGYFQFG
jgi:hypothetical protein